MLILFVCTVCNQFLQSDIITSTREDLRIIRPSPGKEFTLIRLRYTLF